MKRSTPTQRKVRKALRRGAVAIEGGWYTCKPEQFRVNVEVLVSYLRTLPGGRKSRAFKIALKEARAVRDRMIVYPEDWILRSIELARKRPLKVAKPLPEDSPMGAGGPYARSLRAKSAEAEVPSFEELGDGRGDGP